ncbi:MAG TPA: NFACT RNA binding domain-containing protein [Bacteriovoracaceae bacterium]|nr:NFACT RNA binding domain-containing protein [Bacteriovoracaceae bacterium]
MIQYYLDLEQQVKSIREKRLSQGQIQKLYSTAYYISLSIRSPGKTWHLFLGRGSGFEGAWIHESAPPKELRRKDTFLEYLRRHVSSCGFLDVELDPYDRILKLTYQKFGGVQALLLFWKGRKLYFLHHYQDAPESTFKILLSWKGKAFSVQVDSPDLFEYFDELGRHQDKIHELSTPRVTPMGELLDEELKASELKGMNSKPTFLQRKKDNIEEDLRKSRQWQKLQKMLDQGQSLEGYELKVEDQKIKFEGELNPYERRNLLFQKIKKLKRGEGILEQRLQNVDELLQGKTTLPVVSSSIPINRPVWGEEKAGSLKTPVKVMNEEYRVYKLDTCQIGIGLSSQGNDQLRSKWASKEDFWIHLDGLKSAHVIIKPQNQLLPTTEVINLAASIVAHFSHFTDDWIPIIYTQVKNLKGVSGAAGMVTYKKEKHLRCPRVNLDHMLEGTP